MATPDEIYDAALQVYGPDELKTMPMPELRTLMRLVGRRLTALGAQGLSQAEVAVLRERIGGPWPTVLPGKVVGGPALVEIDA